MPASSSEPAFLTLATFRLPRDLLPPQVGRKGLPQGCLHHGQSPAPNPAARTAPALLRTSRKRRTPCNSRPLDTRGPFVSAQPAGQLLSHSSAVLASRLPFPDQVPSPVCDSAGEPSSKRPVGEPNASRFPKFPRSARRATFLRIATAEAWSFRVASDRRFETSSTTSASVAFSCFLEIETEPAWGEAAVAVRLFPRNQCRQLEVPSARAPPRSSLGRSPARSPRFSRSSARLKIVRGWPCEVDAAPLRAERPSGRPKFRRGSP